MENRKGSVTDSSSYSIWGMTVRSGLLVEILKKYKIDQASTLENDLELIVKDENEVSMFVGDVSSRSVVVNKDKAIQAFFNVLTEASKVRDFLGDDYEEMMDDIRKDVDAIGKDVQKVSYAFEDFFWGEDCKKYEDELLEKYPGHSLDELAEGGKYVESYHYEIIDGKPEESHEKTFECDAIEYQRMFTADMKKTEKREGEMVRVGERDTDYTIPTGTGDWGTATVTGGYLMATTQTSYALWFEVRTWAEEHGYHFQNQGSEGSRGTAGAAPTENRLHPVTEVSWRDVIVWLNAFSEMKGFDPVYRDDKNRVIHDSRDANADVVDAAIQTANNGYRLPTSHEWEMAARWKDDTESTDGSILVGGRYWTPGNYASGASGPAWNPTDEEATRAVAWYVDAPGGDLTKPVGQLLPNHLGIYDMSGNVWEWTYTSSRYNRVLRGGGWFFSEYFMPVGDVLNYPPSQVTFSDGFRFVRNP